MRAREASDRHFLVGATRAAGGAILFSLPLLLTMEMWWLGFLVDPIRLAIFLVILLPALAVLAHLAGFEHNVGWTDETVDAFVAVAIGAGTSTLSLFLIGELGPSTPVAEGVAKITLQTVPASIGALVSQSTLGSGVGPSEERNRAAAGTLGEDFLMAIGALFVALPVAPTEEMIQIAYHLEAWRAAAIVVTSLIVMDLFVYAAGFRNAPDVPEDVSRWSTFLRKTLVGYGIALVISAFLLWVFGRLDGTSLEENVAAIVVLGFPAAVGAAAARVIL